MDNVGTKSGIGVEMIKAYKNWRCPLWSHLWRTTRTNCRKCCKSRGEFEASSV